MRKALGAGLRPAPSPVRFITLNEEPGGSLTHPPHYVKGPALRDGFSPHSQNARMRSSESPSDARRAVWGHPADRPSGSSNRTMEAHRLTSRKPLSLIMGEGRLPSSIRKEYPHEDINTDREEDEMWDKMKNLVCAAGHWHYSPTPQAFKGRECFYAVGETAKARCQEKLRLVQRDPA